MPDLAESLELGLNPGRESTNRDKFDDGQELFGQTYCTGQGGFCSYGPLPRNEDWGVIFADAIVGQGTGESSTGGRISSAADRCSTVVAACGVSNNDNDRSYD